MGTNEVYRVGQYVPAPTPAGTPAGAPLLIGILKCVTVTGRTVDENDPNDPFRGNHSGESSVDLGAAFILDVVIAGATLTWGQAIYIKTDGTLTTVATSATLFGAALDYGAAVNAAAQPIVVKILN